MKKILILSLSLLLSHTVLAAEEKIGPLPTITVTLDSKKSTSFAVIDPNYNGCTLKFIQSTIAAWKAGKRNIGALEQDIRSCANRGLNPGAIIGKQLLNYSNSKMLNNIGESFKVPQGF